MTESETTIKLRNTLSEFREARESLRKEIYDFLEGGDPSYGYTGEEQVGEALLLLGIWQVTKDLSKSSARLEKVTWGLAALTLALLVLTIILAFSV